MQLTRLGAMLDELQAVLTAKGCRLTEVSVTFYPFQDGEGRSADDDAYPSSAVISEACRTQSETERHTG